VSSHIPKNRRIYNENCNEVRNKAVSEYQRNNNIERVFGKEVVVVNGNFNSNVLSKINTPVGEKYGNFMFQNIDC
jgi:hypothetical protein